MKKLNKLTKGQVAAIRRSEIEALNKASDKARRLMLENGITPELLEVLGRAPDTALSPAERTTVAACRRAAHLVVAIGPGAPFVRRALH